METKGFGRFWGLKEGGIALRGDGYEWVEMGAIGDETIPEEKFWAS